MSLFMRGRDLLSLADIDDAELRDLLAFARELKTRAACGEELELLRGVHLYLYDADLVLPAWDPFALAMTQLGGRAQRLEPGRINLDWSETFLDLFRQLDLTGHGLAMASVRSGEGQQFMADTAELMSKPVINMLSEESAPFHALASLMALEERLEGELGAASIAISWAPPGLSVKPPSLPLSLSRVLIRSGANLRLACPLEFHPGEDFHQEMDSLVPGAMEISEDPEDAVIGADVVFAFNWGRADGEDARAEAEVIAGRHENWRFTRERWQRAAAGALLGGGLPQSRGREIEGELLEDAQTFHLDEVANILHIAKAVLALTLDINQE